MGRAGGWLDRHRAELRALFEALGLESSWVGSDDEALIRYMERVWLGREHGAQVGKPTFTAAQQQAALPLLDRLGFVAQVDPDAERYDEVVVLGASGIGLHRRLELVRTSGVEAPVLTVLAGMRPHERAPRDGGLSELLAPGGRFAAAPGWELPPALAHCQAALAADLEGDLTGEERARRDLLAAAQAFPHETALAELLLAKQWPGLVATGTRHAPPHPVVNELGQREWDWRTFEAPGPFAQIRVLNGAPVERHGAPSRPTAISTIREWLARSEPSGRRRILGVVNQPHIPRNRLELPELLRREGRPDLELHLAGCGASLATSGIVLVLGEIPAFINADRRING